MKKVLITLMLFLTVGLFAAPPSYLILIQQDAMREYFNASFAPSDELKAELDKLGFVCGMRAVDSKLTLDVLKQFNVIVIGVDQSDFKLSLPDEEAARLGKMLVEYVQQGGGILFTRNGGYQFGKDIVALNRMLKPFDAFVFNEQIVDRSKRFDGAGCKLYWTDQINATHPVTKGVKGLFYPEPHGPYPTYTDFTSPIEVGADWTVLAYGSDTAWSFEREKAGKRQPEKPGHFTSRPPFIAARQFGKGRIVLNTVTSPLTFEETHHPFWNTGKLTAGEFEGKPGDMMKLMVNTFAYLAEPSKGVFGGFNSPWHPRNLESKEPGTISIDWDKINVDSKKLPGKNYLGLLGVQSNLSGGKGTPQEFIDAAKKAGYNYLAFAEDLANLTPEKMDELKKICAAAACPGFRAYPGFRYLDDTGCSWMTFSDKVSYPPKDWCSKQFPGRIINQNPISRGWNWLPVILLNAHKNPQKPYFKGNYKFISIYTYDKDNKLSDDSLDYYFYLSQNRFIASASTVRLIDDPAQVAEARKSGYQNITRWYDDDVIKAYTGRYCDYKGAYQWFRPVYISEGPTIEDLTIINFGTSDLSMKDNDRMRVHVSVNSADGVKEVILHDGDKPSPLRRLEGKKDQKQLSFTFERYHTDRMALIPEIIDFAGHRAIGFEGWTSIQENEYGRCTDNINTWHTGKWWGCPKGRHNMRALEDYMISRNFIYHGTPYFAELGDEGCFPRVEYKRLLSCRHAIVIECDIENHYIGKTSYNHDENDEVFPIVPNEYYKGKVVYYLFTGRQNNTLFYWIDGELEVLKPFKSTLMVANLYMRANADMLTVGKADGTETTTNLRKTPGKLNGPVERLGFAAIHPQPFLGPIGFIPFTDNMTYKTNYIQSRYNITLHGNVGDPIEGVSYQAGDKIHYRYLIGTGAFQSEPGVEFLTSARALGLDGKGAYTVNASVGSAEPKEGILRVASKGNAFVAEISQADLPIDLPVIESGLNPNWDAGIVYCGHNTTMKAIYEKDEHLQRSIVFKPYESDNELQHIAVMENGNGICQIDLTAPRKVFIGNLLVCDNADVKLQVADVRTGKRCYEVHNPTHKQVTVTVRPAEGFTLLGNFTKKLTLAPGTSTVVKVD